jgi:transcription termination factor Rho
MLESKDKEQLSAIAQALGIKVSARLKKADIIQKILETTGSLPAPTADVAPSPSPVEEAATLFADTGSADSGAAEDAAPAPTTDAPSAGDVPEIVLGPDGEPLAEWEIELMRSGEPLDAAPTTTNGSTPVRSGAPRGPRPADQRSAASRPTDPRPAVSTTSDDDDASDGSGADGDSGDRFDPDGDGETRSSRRRRRRRGKGPREEGAEDAPRPGGQPGGQSSHQPASSGQSAGQSAGHSDQQGSTQDLIEVAGYLDLRDEGYGFLRVSGYLPSKDDVYIPVKQTRQFGLRKGDHVTGLSRPAGRNEKNPALIELHTVNGGDPEDARSRRRFEDLTALFPDSRLRLEDPRGHGDMTARIIDLVAPIGKGQRGIIVSPPKAGKTTVMKTIATAIERNNPEVKLIVLLIDERPEEVTDMKRHVAGEVIASTFDRPSEQHTQVAEMALEKAKRMVEAGDDVVIILDGITRLSRAYNLAAPASGRILSGGIDAGALYPPKKFFGAARNIEEGGSLTILATALVETNSRMDEAIFEEFKGTGNMELRLDRRLAERRIYPAIDVDASSTRHEELLFDRKQLQQVWKLRRVLSGLAADGNAAPGLELLMDRLKTFRTNDEFLAEIAKQPTM